MKNTKISAALIVGLLALTASLAFSSTVSAAPPDFVLQIPEGSGAVGSGAGQLDNPRGIAADPDTGHIYAADRRNARIDEFTAWGAFVKAWGWDVAPEGAPGDTASDQLEVCTTLCQAGAHGNGAGQINAPFGIGLDSGGDIFVFESAFGGEDNRRVQKFEPEGHFLAMFGGEVDKTTKANLCTKADLEGGDVCGAGVPGTGPGEFSNGSIGNYLTYDPATNTIFVGDVDRIEEFNLNGAFKGEIPFAGELQAFDGKSVRGLAADSAGDLYLALESTEDVFKLSSSGAPLDPGKPGASGFEARTPLGVAVDVEGDVYAIDDPPGGQTTLAIVEFDAAANKLMPSKEEEAAEELFPYIPFLGPAITGLATNICAGSESPGSLYASFYRGTEPELSYLQAYGSGPVGCEAPPPNPPQIAAQYASAVSRDDATLKAQINPRFWQDATYQVHYGTGKCSEGGCEGNQPALPAKLTSKAVNRAVSTAGVSLTGLEPGTTYHYRFVAQSSGGGPVAGEERTFTTFAAAPLPPACPANEAFRSGPSAALPDCRAYEMVSPLDKGNGDVAPWLGAAGKAPRQLEINQSASSGERFAFGSPTAFAGPEGAPFFSEYLASRDSAGWSSRPLSAPHTESPVSILYLLDGEFQGFTPDLCSAWVRHYSVAPLAPGAIANYPNLYRRESCAGSGGYEALSTVEPPDRPAEEYIGLQALGSSADGTHAIFTANGKLSEDAPALKDLRESVLYDHTTEGLRFVCYLPSGKASPQACSAGMLAGTADKEASAHNAISTDGQRIFWSAYTGPGQSGTTPEVPGQIYVRIGGSETRKVSGSVSPEPAWYWTAAKDGSKAIFELSAGPHQGELYEFDVDTETPRLIAKGVLGPMGASEDASRIYFASTEDLDGGGPAGKGADNLYLYEADGEGGAGTFAFIMALRGRDIGGDDAVQAPVDQVPAQRSARVSPDGLHAAFTATVSPAPTGYDNTDAASGEADQEVYLYDAGEHKLRCASCNPTNARPSGENIGSDAFPFWAVAKIQGWEIFQHAPRVLSDDGSRLYFESHEALAPEDTNGAWDVYQWEAPGAGSCTQAEASFSAAAEGCIGLISSGQSAATSTFFDADASGENVFIGTQSSLVASDYGLNDVYDARVDGGFAEPATPAACEGEACQGPPSAPNDPTPASAGFEGAGNVVEKPAKKARKHHRRKHRRHAKHKRGATR